MLVGFLQAETLQQDNQMRSSLNQVYQFGALAFTILGVAATVLAQHKQYTVLLALAPAALAIWLMGLRGLVEMFALAAYRNWLECHLQKIVNKAGAAPIFAPWDDTGGSITRKSVANATVFAFFAVAAGVVCGGSLAVAWQKLPSLRTFTILDATACGVFTIAAVISFIQMISVYTKTTELLIENTDRSAGNSQAF
jgi:hypothetical protein